MPDEDFEPDLLSRIADVVKVGDVIPTLGQGRPNRIDSITDAGVFVTTERSHERTGESALVPAWMFNEVWAELVRKGCVERDEVDRRAERKVKRSSAVFAILERLPEVSIAQPRPLVLELRARS